eukprot:764280-Hanusia_phi.AAC.10
MPPELAMLVSVRRKWGVANVRRGDLAGRERWRWATPTTDDDGIHQTLIRNRTDNGKSNPRWRCDPKDIGEKGGTGAS